MRAGESLINMLRLFKYSKITQGYIPNLIRIGACKPFPNIIYVSFDKVFMLNQINFWEAQLDEKDSHYDLVDDGWDPSDFEMQILHLKH